MNLLVKVVIFTPLNLPLFTLKLLLLLVSFVSHHYLYCNTTTITKCTTKNAQPTTTILKSFRSLHSSRPKYFQRNWQVSGRWMRRSCCKLWRHRLSRRRRSCKKAKCYGCAASPDCKLRSVATLTSFFHARPHSLSRTVSVVSSELNPRGLWCNYCWLILLNQLRTNPAKFTDLKSLSLYSVFITVTECRIAPFISLSFGLSYPRTYTHTPPLIYV